MYYHFLQQKKTRTFHVFLEKKTEKIPSYRLLSSSSSDSHWNKKLFLSHTHSWMLKKWAKHMLLLYYMWWSDEIPMLFNIVYAWFDSCYISVGIDNQLNMYLSLLHNLFKSWMARVCVWWTSYISSWIDLELKMWIVNDMVRLK